MEDLDTTRTANAGSSTNEKQHRNYKPIVGGVQ